MRKILIILIALIAVLLALSPLVFYFFNFSGDFSTSNSDWGSFGSYVGGTVGATLSGLSFIVLAITLIITIKHNVEERKTTRESLELTKISYKEQIEHQRKEFNLLLINSYIDTLDKQLTSKVYNEAKCDDEKDFCDKVLKWFKHFVEVNPESKDVFTLAFCALNELHVRYDTECITLGSIEKIIISEPDDEVQHHFRAQLMAKINPELVFWLQIYLCHCSEGYKDKIIANKLFQPTVRILDAFPEHCKKRKEDKDA
ncbi:hypothetical protein [Thalassomonas actiniarum]|uniref:Phage abortive infection protein n=1 Tax=Thalassomonas actiniarum TaxID=485447 RepID=A0AAF0C4T9_9GAMM|nr:hypothetical protein [Thalassomonas actiniarum]WDE00344.1 hypothetical protein SG35_006800 [Thalassomonas actiniarum]